MGCSALGENTICLGTPCRASQRSIYTSKRVLEILSCGKSCWGRKLVSVNLKDYGKIMHQFIIKSNSPSSKRISANRHLCTYILVDCKKGVSVPFPVPTILLYKMYLYLLSWQTRCTYTYPPVRQGVPVPTLLSDKVYLYLPS